MTTIYSIGHSRHSGERFTALLRAQQIARLVDVRSYPVSKWAPQFEKLALARLLARHAIEYLFLGRELGGKRAELYGADGSLEYARRAQAPDFQAAIVRLAALRWRASARPRCYARKRIPTAAIGVCWSRRRCGTPASKWCTCVVMGGWRAITIRR
jgi:hypothetical protein